MCTTPAVHPAWWRAATWVWKGGSRSVGRLNVGEGRAFPDKHIGRFLIKKLSVFEVSAFGVAVSGGPILSVAV